MENQKLPPVGTKVFELYYGWGEIIEITPDVNLPIRVRFKTCEVSYTPDGRLYIVNTIKTLSLTEYSLTEGGFTPISEWNKPKVGDVGYFWDEIGDIGFMHYGIIKDIREGKFFDTTSDCLWENFTKEIPEWYLKKIEELKNNLKSDK